MQQPMDIIIIANGCLLIRRFRQAMTLKEKGERATNVHKYIRIGRPSIQSSILQPFLFHPFVAFDICRSPSRLLTVVE